MLWVFRVLFALIIMFFIPGYTLVQMIWPNRKALDHEEDGLFRILLAPVLSLPVIILVIIVLSGISVSADRGLVTSPFIELSLIVVSAAFFGVGYYRGAYPILGRGAWEVEEPSIPKEVLGMHEDLLFVIHRLEEKKEKLTARAAQTPNDPVIAKKLTAVESNLKKAQHELRKLEKPPEVRNLIEEAEELHQKWSRTVSEVKDLEARGGDPVKIERLKRKGQRIEARIEEIKRSLSQILYEQPVEVIAIDDFEDL